MFACRFADVLQSAYGEGGQAEPMPSNALWPVRTVRLWVAVRNGLTFDGFLPKLVD